MSIRSSKKKLYISHKGGHRRAAHKTVFNKREKGAVQYVYAGATLRSLSLSLLPGGMAASKKRSRLLRLDFLFFLLPAVRVSFPFPPPGL